MTEINGQCTQCKNMYKTNKVNIYMNIKKKPKKTHSIKLNKKIVPKTATIFHTKQTSKNYGIILRTIFRV